MASIKRTVIELSSDSDDDNPLVTRRKIRRRSNIPQSQHRVSAQDQATFTEFLSRALPSKLISSDVAEYIQRESNIRLETARQEGIMLDDVFIGRDCLPTWIGMQWDPQRESLHCAIQDRLMDLDVSDILGDVLRTELMDKGNRKLEEARQLGVGIENITIGKGLLATWITLESSQETAYGLKTPVRTGRAELIDDDTAQSSLETTNPHSSTVSRGGTPDSDITTISSPTVAQNSPYIVYDSSSTYDSCSDFGSSGDTSDDSTEDDEETDDVIQMNNSVNPQPEYSESDGEAPHILYDIEIAGGREGYLDVDLEVYLVEDDEEVEDLPELELAIDGDAFTYYFGDNGVVEVEIPGMDLRCLLDVPRDQSDEGDQAMEDGQPFEEIDDDYDDDCGMDEGEDEQPDAQGNDGANTQQDGLEASLVAPMLQSEDEQNTRIQITVDGFTW
ncbi:hypothetical protein V8C42DRAFT_347392 [Trichoderma barbatum]